MQIVSRLKKKLGEFNAIVLLGDASILEQVCSATAAAGSTDRKKLRDRRPAVRQRMKWEDGQGNDHFADVSFGFDHEGAIREVFCLAKKEGSDMQGLVHDACIATSIALQRGERVADLAKSFGELRREGEIGGKPASVMGYLLRLAASVEANVQGSAG
jgi:hypothetical protein